MAREKSSAFAQDYQARESKKIDLQIGDDRVIGVHLKTVEKKSANSSKSLQETPNLSAWERFQATMVTGTVDGDENSSVILVLTETGMNGSVKIPSENAHYSLQGDSVSTYQIKVVPATNLKCGVMGNAK